MRIAILGLAVLLAACSTRPAEYQTASLGTYSTTPVSSRSTPTVYKTNRGLMCVIDEGGSRAFYFWTNAPRLTPAEIRDNEEFQQKCGSPR